MVTRGEGWGEGILRGFGINMDMLLYLKWIPTWACMAQGILLNVMWQSGGERIPVYGWLSCSAAHLKLSHSCDKYKIKNLKKLPVRNFMKER